MKANIPKELAKREAELCSEGYNVSEHTARAGFGLANSFLVLSRPLLLSVVLFQP